MLHHARLTMKRSGLLPQLVRFAVNGVLVTSLYTAVFVGLDTYSDAPVQLCNLSAFLVSVMVGYVLHSRITFRNHGARGLGSQVRFVVAALPGFAINTFWVWLFATRLGLPHWTVQLPIWFITPFAIFAINRWWVFR